MAPPPLNFFGLLAPDFSGSVIPQTTGLLDTNDLMPYLPVLVFKDTATLITAGCSFQIPSNYVGSAVVRLRFKTTLTSGNVLWTLDWVARAVGESGDPSAWDESLAGTATAVNGTTNRISEVSFSLTSSGIVAGDEFFVRIGRNGAGADTVSGSMQLIGAVLEYSDV